MICQRFHQWTNDFVITEDMDVILKRRELGSQELNVNAKR
jgi:hypothetical protein